MMRRLFSLVLFAFLLAPAPAAALAAEGVPAPNAHQALPTLQLLALLVGGLTPAIGYMLNTRAPWISEPVKALAQVVLAAAAGAVVQLIDTGAFALDTETLQIVVTAVVGALMAHKTLWLPSGVSARLGGGQNRNG